MNNEELEQLKKQIQDKVITLQALLNSHGVINNVDDEQDNLSEAEVNQQIIEKTRQELTSLEKGLNRLDSDDAGICEHCGCEIPFARLQAVPVATLCIQCAEEESQP